MHAGKEMACRVLSDTQRKQFVRDGFLQDGFVEDGFVKLENAIPLGLSQRRTV